VLAVAGHRDVRRDVVQVPSEFRLGAVTLHVTSDRHSVSLSSRDFQTNQRLAFGTGIALLVTEVSDMKLSQEQFFKGTYNYRTEANGPVHSVPRYSYESAGRLYDVIQFPFGTVYQVNGDIHLVSSPIHREILTHFGEQHAEWTYGG
jgi:hypothetical protein